MPRLFTLLFCLLSLCGVGQRRIVVRNNQPQMVHFFPKMGLGGSTNYFRSGDDEFFNQYGSWADLAERSRTTKHPILLQLTLDTAGQLPPDWSSLRRVQRVRSLNLSLPNRFSATAFDSLLHALANWPELVHIDISSNRIDLKKSTQLQTGPEEQSRVMLPTVQTANFFGTGADLVTCVDFLRHCPSLNQLTINGFGSSQKPLPLPAELGQLTQLKTLHLSNGSGVSNLDSALAGLTQLTTLYMTNTGNGPTLTKALRHLPKLRRLELRFGFTDDELDGLRLSALHQLDTLELYFISGVKIQIDSVLAGVSSLKLVTVENALLSTLDWMADNPGLRGIVLTGCRFPPSKRSLAKLAQLTTVAIDQADSLGTFPDQFTTLPNLRELSIPDAQLSTLPASIGALTSLTALNLYHNKLQTLPAEVGKLNALKRLNLGNNQFVALPDALLRLLSLENLALYDNQLNSLPAGIGQLPRLQHLFLSNNQLATLPNELGQCRKLQSLVVDNNPLTALPETIGKLDSLQTLTLTDTRLRTLPTSVGRLVNLRNLAISGGRLSSLPNELGNCQKLDRFALNDSSLMTLPSSLALLKRLTVLSLTLPQLRVLPDDVTRLTNLTELTIQMPQLLVLPNELGNLTNLRELTVRSRKLLGLPNSLGRLTHLTRLHIDGEVAPEASQPFGAMELLPDSIIFCTGLTDLRVENQQAFDGTDAIRKTARLPKLNRLSMVRCSIDQLADIDWKRVLFSSLYLEENNLRTVPESLLTAPNLQSVNLVGNTRLPAGLSQIFMNKDTLRKALSSANRQR